MYFESSSLLSNACTPEMFSFEDSHCCHLMNQLKPLRLSSRRIVFHKRSVAFLIYCIFFRLESTNGKASGGLQWNCSNGKNRSQIEAGVGRNCYPSAPQMGLAVNGARGRRGWGSNGVPRCGSVCGGGGDWHVCQLDHCCERLGKSRSLMRCKCEKAETHKCQNNRSKHPKPK